MKNSLKIILLIVALSLVPNGVSAWNGQVTQVEKTVVQVQADGSDTYWITVAVSNEAKGLTEFADNFNKTAYRGDLTPAEKCETLTVAAYDAIKQRSTTFYGLHDVLCSAGDGSPELTMVIYPQTTYDYRFFVSFTPSTE